MGLTGSETKQAENLSVHADLGHAPLWITDCVFLGLWICSTSHSFTGWLEKRGLFPSLQNWLPTLSRKEKGEEEEKTPVLSILSSMSFQQTASYVSDLCQPIFCGFHTIIRGHRALIIIFTFHLLYQSSCKRLISSYEWIPRGMGSIGLHRLQLIHSG